MTISEAYKILEVSENSSEEEIKAAYKKLARKYHPDFYQNNPLASLAEEKLKEINEAYEVLEKYFKEEKNKPIEEYYIERDPKGIEVYFDKRTRRKITGKVSARTMLDGIKILEIRNGYADGLSTVYSEYGVKLLEETYEKGIICGEILNFSVINNKINTRENYLKGIKHGKEINGFNEDEYKYGKEIGPRKIYDYETKNIAEVREIPDNIILKMEDIDTYYEDGFREGKANLYYTNGIEEVKYIRGRVTGFSTFHNDNGEITKYYYSYGRRRENKIIKKIQSKNLDDIYNLKYKRENKEYLVGMKQEEYVFFKILKKIYNLQQDFKTEFLKGYYHNTRNFKLEDLFDKYLSFYEDYLLNLANSFPLNEADFYNAKVNEVDFDLRKELQPESLEDFAIKIRKRDIQLKFYDFRENIEKYMEQGITRNRIILEEVIDKIVDEIKILILNKFYPKYKSQNFCNYSIPSILKEEYWICVFKEAIKTEEISDDLIEILNVILKDEVDIVNLLNIYIGIKYKMSSFVKEAIENLKKIKKYSSYYSKDILENIFGLKDIEKVKDFILCLDYLLNNQEINIDTKEKNISELRKLYEKLEKFIVEVKDNTMFVSYKKEIENFNGKLQKFNFEILNLERELNNKKKQEMNLKIEKCGKLLSELKMKYLETDIDRDKTEFEEIENNIKFLSDIKSNELTDEQLEKLSKLKEINDLAIHKITVYENELTEMSKDREKIQNDKTFTPITCLIGAIIGVYFIFKNFNGLITMIAIPVIFTIASKIISSVKQETDKKTKELNLKQKNINSIINVAQRINKILDSFL
ncbi:DnaJ domain-containing protein [uncultured Fusobacterium sp.]|uniref:DnaJ domain-containing protein n=1 Tax=uncultured Fusobacterium sp. TaxID=159267 RepID=UPI0025F22D5F|nr:DnaJ domain-containing protein [uncultured Fusobacterium sp.]